MKGYIKLHRKIQEWGWYSDVNTKAVFLELLLRASYEEKEYRGGKLKKGQCVFGRKELAEKLGISERSVRTAVNHLKSTNELTTETTNKFTIATIVNWEVYQTDNEKPTNKATNKTTNNRPTTDQQTTTNKKVRKKEGKNIYIVPEHLEDVFSEWVQMRKMLKKPLTENACKRALASLEKLTKDKNKQIKIVEQSIDRNWLSFYPLKTEETKRYKEFEIVEDKNEYIEMPKEIKEKIGGIFK